MTHPVFRRRTSPLAAVVLCVSTVAAAHSSAIAAEVEVYSGQPFGVGRVTLPVGGRAPAVPLEDERFTVASPDGRVLYPVLKEEPVRRVLRRLLNIETPRNATIYFLFSGDGPLQLEAYSPLGQTIAVTPTDNPAGHARLLAEWWQEYGNRWKSLRKDPQFPPVVENFLAANLARRLNLTLPETTPGLLDVFATQKKAMDDLLVTETHQLTLDQQLLAADAPAAAEIGPLPPPMPWFDIDPPAPVEGQPAAEVPVEPIALHVPAECFYLRFGDFTNYLWFRDLNRKWQGDLANMFIRRGIDRAARDRLEQQLAIRESKLAKVLGPQVIADVAIIGLDPYMTHGAAIGILFQAKASPLLAADLVGQRREALKTFPDATETTIKIADRDVSLISTPGGEVRSYYVIDGDFHVVTTSRHLAQRFLQVGQGDRALAASAGFLHARQRIAFDRGDAVFAYISPEFFRALTSPAVWIESQRRARSLREMKLIDLARLEAAAEGVVATTPDELIATGFLPTNLSRRSDGSELKHTDAGPVDSLRGTPGRFLPVADMEVAGATPAEAAAYRTFGDRFRQEVGQTPPIAIGIRRTPLADGSGETMAAEVFAAPLDGVKLGRLPDMLGDPSDQRVGPVEGDLIRGELVLDAILPFPSGDSEPHHFFFAAHDFGAQLVARGGRLSPAGPLSELAHIYWGTWPKPGLLKLFAPAELAEGPDPVPAPRDAWQAKQGDFLLMSFQPEMVRQVLPELFVEQVERPAQVWLNVVDLTGTELSGVVNSLGYMRARETCVAACRLMNTLANQLHVPRDQCRGVAEKLMDGQFICPLGGEYEVVEVLGGQPAWTSTALAPENRFLLTQPPDDFTLPLLTWFKGLRADLQLGDAEISGHAEVDMAKSAVP